MTGFSAALALSGLLAGVPQPLRLSADVEDAYALRVNPAGLHLMDGGELRLVYGRSPALGDRTGLESGSTQGLGLFVGAPVFDAVGLGASLSLDFDPEGRTAVETALGAAFGSRRVSLGLGWTHQSPFEGEARGFVTAGLTLRPWSVLAVGVTVRDLAQAAMRREWDLGLALRPFDRLILSGQWRLTQSQPLDGDHLNLSFLASAEPFDGVGLGFGVAVPPAVGGERNLAFTAQLSLGFEHIAVGTSIAGLGSDASLAVEVALNGRGRPGIGASARVIVMDLSGELVPSPSFDFLNLGFDLHPYGTAPLTLRGFADREDVAGALLRIGSLEIGWGKASELRAAILDVRAAKKRVDCQLLGSDDLAYYVASACNTIVIAPPQISSVNGLSARVLFFGETLDHLGIEVAVARHGDYKSTPEQLTRSGMSAPQREALGAYLDDVYDSLVEAIASGRSLEREAVLTLLSAGVMTSTEALSAKLVDRILYPDELEDWLRETYGGPVRFARADRPPVQRSTWSVPDEIAIVHIDATISGGESNDLPLGLGQTSGATTLVRALEELRVTPSVRAVVLRVDSPGGDAFASDLIARAVRRLAAEKPVIASFGDVAASGGYYAAAAAHVIYAEPTTLTGSIGVFSLEVSAAQLMERLGVHASVINRGERSDTSATFRPINDDDRAMMAKHVADAYRQFLDVVADGRKMDREAVRQVAEGRIWSGRAAKANGLVDELGGLHDAIARAKTDAGLAADAPVRLTVHPGDRGPLPAAAQAVMSAFFPAPAALGAILPAEVRRALGAVLGVVAGASGPKALALIPFAVRVE